MTGLRDLDDRVVPRAAARLRGAVEAAGTRRAALRDRVGTATLPAGPALLRRLDERFARRGPLALLRDAPQVGLAVAGAVLLAGAGTAVVRGGDAAEDGTRVAAGALALGPEVGDDVAAYVAGARERAAARSEAAPEAVHLALVSLSAGLPPGPAGALLEGDPAARQAPEVLRVYLRVPTVDQAEVLATDVQDLVPDLQALYAATAARKAEDRDEYVTLSRSTAPTSPEQRQVRDSYELSAQIAGREAAAYRTGCACVFAVVVRGTAGALAALPALSGVRAVELAPQGAVLDELQVRPLGPEQTTTVGATSMAGPGG